MANPQPVQARMAKKKRQRTGNLPALQRKLWVALLHAEDILEHADEPELRLKAIHALSQCAGQYAKLLEVGEWEARLAQVETLVHERKSA